MDCVATNSALRTYHEHRGFQVTAPLVPIADCEFRFEATDGGCRVEETWVDRRWLPIRFISTLRTGVADRRRANRDGMQHTLAALKSEAEATTVA